MMYLFYGTDVEKTRAKAFEWIAKARTKEPNLVYVRLSREELTAQTLEDAALSGGLFVKRLLILIDDPFPSARVESEEEGSEDTAGSVFEEHITALADSDNAIVILAPRLATAKAKKLTAKAKMTYVYDKPATREDARGFNTNLVNALATRSREKLWLELNRALYAGDAPEMLHGLLHWKARDLMEKGARAWKPQESRALSLSLIELLQNSRRGGLDLSLSLERFALSI
jgi:DNA polymerase III delta subunit